MPNRKKPTKVRGVANLKQVVGWMSDEDRQQLQTDLGKHPQFEKGQSEFINCAALALRKATEAGKELAQPLSFLTVEQRDKLAVCEHLLKEREVSVRRVATRAPGKYGAKKGKKR